MNTPIYLDYNATTPVDKRVLETMLPYFSEKFGNAGSKTHSFGWIAEEAVKIAREQVASLIGSEPEEVIFTSGATESVNLAIKGTYEIYKNKGNHIITVSTEHKAVLDTCASLEKKGAEITYLSVDREGLIDIDLLKKSISDKTILICVMYANNETGVLQAIQQIGEIAKEKGIILMTDATQAVGKMRTDVNEDHVDILCLSAHKIYGPKGVGALYVRRKNPRVKLAPLIDGGGHENGLRSGTLNVPAIVGLGKACEIAQFEMWEDSIRLSRLRTHLEQSLTEIENVYINGSLKRRMPNVSNICFRNLKAEAIIKQLNDIAVATGSACSSATMQPSHVLKAMGLSDDQAYSSIRFSLGKYTTKEEIAFTVEKMSSIISEMRSV